MIELRSEAGATLWRLEVADSWFKRLRGLIGRPALERGEGLYLPGTNGVHMLFMGFAIDCLFLGAARPDGRREIVAIHARLRPWRGVVWWVRGAKGVVEVAAGSAAGAGIQRGDLVRLEPA